MGYSRYRDLRERLVSNIYPIAPNSQCWWWKRKLGKGNYGRINVYVPCIGEVITLQAHISLWIWLHAEPKSIDEFWWQYQSFIASGLELDHECVDPPCINPQHLKPVTPKENCQLRDQRRKKDLCVGMYSYSR